MELTIKEFSIEFNVSEHTIRYYNDIGLLPCKRNKANKRIFDEASYNWMKIITCLKKCGASIETIKNYCELCKKENTKDNLITRYSIILEQKKEALKRAQEAKETLEYMDYKIKHYEDIINGLIPDDTTLTKKI